MSNVFGEQILAGKVAYVAGGTRGMNLAIAIRFAQQGAKVVVMSRSEERCAQAAESIREVGGEAMGLPADARDYDRVAETMAQLAEAGLLDDTIVVLFSDHGEEHYAEDLPYAYMGPNHGFHPYGDGQLRVLMAVRFPDGLGAGETVAGHARLMDLLPTLIEALGLTWPGELGGRSLLPLVRGEEADPENSRQVYVETGVSERRYWNEGHLGYPFDRVSERYVVHPETGRVHIRAEFFDHLVAAKDRVLQRGRWKLVYRPMEPAEGQLHRAQIELFDRVADPLNRTDLSGLEPEVLAELGLELVEHLRSDGIEIPQEREWATLVAETADVGGESE